MKRYLYEMLQFKNINICDKKGDNPENETQIKMQLSPFFVRSTLNKHHHRSYKAAKRMQCTTIRNVFR